MGGLLREDTVVVLDNEDHYAAKRNQVHPVGGTDGMDIEEERMRAIQEQIKRDTVHWVSQQAINVPPPFSPVFPQRDVGAWPIHV